MSASAGESPSLLRRLAGQHSNELGLLVAILVVVAATTIFSDAYREKPLQNVQEILRQTSLLGVFALGAAIVIISGGIDLSSGSVIAFSGAICASIMLALAPLDASGAPDTNNLGLRYHRRGDRRNAARGFSNRHASRLADHGGRTAAVCCHAGLARRAAQPRPSHGAGSDDGPHAYRADHPDLHLRSSLQQLGTRWWIPLVIFLVLSAVWPGC